MPRTVSVSGNAAMCGMGRLSGSTPLCLISLTASNGKRKRLNAAILLGFDSANDASRNYWREITEVGPPIDLLVELF